MAECLVLTRLHNPAMTSRTSVTLVITAFVRSLSKLGFFLIARTATFIHFIIYPTVYTI